MSILSKKLYVQKTGGTAVACNIYSTSAEAGDKALRVKIDNTDGYIALKATDDANATGMRVKIGTVIYAVATKHESGGVAIPYTESYWTEAGSHSFTVALRLVTLLRWQRRAVTMTSATSRPSHLHIHCRRHPIRLWVA